MTDPAASSALSGVRRDADWRPLDPMHDALADPDRDRRPWPEDCTRLYWWRRGYLSAGPNERLRSHPEQR